MKASSSIVVKTDAADKSMVTKSVHPSYAFAAIVVVLAGRMTCPLPSGGIVHVAEACVARHASTPMIRSTVLGSMSRVTQ